MRILYLSQYFPPEVGATQNRAYEMASIFVKQGHDVTVLTEVPNHPSGIIHPDFRRKFSVRSKWDGIDIFRVWVITSSKKSFLNRMLFYISFMVNATIAGLLIIMEAAEQWLFFIKEKFFRRIKTKSYSGHFPDKTVLR